MCLCAFVCLCAYMYVCICVSSEFIRIAVKRPLKAIFLLSIFPGIIYHEEKWWQTQSLELSLIKNYNFFFRKICVTDALRLLQYSWLEAKELMIDTAYFFGIVAWSGVVWNGLVSINTMLQHNAKIDIW